MFFSRFAVRRAWRVAASCGALAAWAALSGCGGGTTQFEVFNPDQLVVFGDENSLVTAAGRKYSVNALNSTDAIACRSEPIWTQAVADTYSFDFAECHPDTTREVKAVMLAAPGAKVDDLKAQVDRLLALGTLPAKVMTTVMIGSNDVLELYAAYPAQSEEQLTAELRARGERLAQQINRLIDLGAKVVVSTIPDLGTTPFARAEKAAFTDTDRAALLTRLTAALNGRMRVTVLNDGRFLGMVLADEMTQSMLLSPTSFGLTNATDVVCTVALPDCTAKTLVTSGTSATYLWADHLHMAHGGHLRLGLLAVARARGNPF